VPVDAVPFADSVSVLVFLVLLGLKDAVTPAGRLDADNPTLPIKPFCGMTVMVEVALAPRARLNEFGEAERAKFGGGVTVRETVVTCDSPPDVPVIVTVAVPRTAELLAVNESVLVEVVLLGLNAAVTPLGTPEAEKLTPLVNPVSGLTLIVLVPFVPRATLRLPGEADRV
jgi:hypothetical protein